MHFAVLLHWADRLRLIVQQAVAPAPLPPIAPRLLTRGPVEPAARTTAPRPDPPGSLLAWPRPAPMEGAPGVAGAAAAMDRTVIRLVRILEHVLRRASIAPVAARVPALPPALAPMRWYIEKPAAVAPLTVGRAGPWQARPRGTGRPQPMRPERVAGPPLVRASAAPAASATAPPVRGQRAATDLRPEPARRPDTARRRPGRPRPAADVAGTPGRAPRRPTGFRPAWSGAQPRMTPTAGPIGLIGSGAAAEHGVQAGAIRRLPTPQAGPEPHPTTSEPRPLARRTLLHRHPGAPDPLAGARRTGRTGAPSVHDGISAWATRPAARIHRRTPEAPAGPRPGSVVPDVPAGRPAPSSPPFDLDQLDRDLWRRFEKRIRVEQQRRGRG
ncbi:hypothetical protein [Modestobacter marinus]|uniref:hypothetical protein n=1 Tax=Modestobacter marinus TaxID=477641 RepID=UPI001C941D48|nr:hypothetical protein [Modestobacter marinus]